MRSYWDEDLAILSAENVSFSIETAGLGSRFAALALDSFYQILVLSLLSLLVLAFDSYVFELSQITHLALYSVAVFVLFIVYYFVFEWLWDGQTPGKRFFGMRVMMSSGLPLTVTAALARNAVRVVDFLPLSYGFGALVSVSNPLNQRMGDLVAGTIVVRENKEAKQRKPLSINEAVEAFLSAATTVPDSKNAVSNAYHEDETLQMESAPLIDSEAVGLSRRLTREDYELARDYIARRDSLPPLARERLGRALAVRLSTKLETSPPADFEGFIGDILAVLGRVYA